MTKVLDSFSKEVIKSRKRVRNYGEVFTPEKIVKMMLDLPGIRGACQDLTATFLEPAVGEGAFLVEVLSRKMSMVAKNYNDTITRYENYSLLALSTLYGIELLEDNAQRCVMNMLQAYYEAYQRQARKHGQNPKPKVLESAKLIISKNIVQGNFLNQLSISGKPLVFSEWAPTNIHKNPKVLIVQRTEHTLMEILDQGRKNSSTDPHYKIVQKQLTLFSEEGATEPWARQIVYKPVRITDVYKEEREESNGLDGH